MSQKWNHLNSSCSSAIIIFLSPGGSCKWKYIFCSFKLQPYAAGGWGSLQRPYTDNVPCSSFFLSFFFSCRCLFWPWDQAYALKIHSKINKKNLRVLLLFQGCRFSAGKFNNENKQQLQRWVWLSQVWKKDNYSLSTMWKQSTKYKDDVSKERKKKNISFVITVWISSEHEIQNLSLTMQYTLPSMDNNLYGNKIQCADTLQQIKQH